MSVAIRVVRLGSPRSAGEGLRLGTVRRLPRGVRKTDYGRRDFFDVWYPELAPSSKLVSWALSEPFTAPRWARYVKSYRREMREPSASAHARAARAAIPPGGLLDRLLLRARGPVPSLDPARAAGGAGRADGVAGSVTPMADEPRRPDAVGLTVRHEEARDAGPIARLHESAFPTPAEAALVGALRAAGRLALSLVAIIEEGLVGHVAFSPVTIVSPDDDREPAPGAGWGWRPWPSPPRIGGAASAPRCSRPASPVVRATASATSSCSASHTTTGASDSSAPATGGSPMSMAPSRSSWCWSSGRARCLRAEVSCDTRPSSRRWGARAMAVTYREAGSEH